MLLGELPMRGVNGTGAAVIHVPDGARIGSDFEVFAKRAHLQRPLRVGALC